MNNFKVTVETKSRSKVVQEVAYEDSLKALQQSLLDCLQTGAFRVSNTIFNSANVNYIQVEEIE